MNKFLISLILVAGVSTNAQAQKGSKEKRVALGYQLILDSASNYIQLAYLELRPRIFRDSLFVFSDTTCIHYSDYYDSSVVKTRCYNDYDNYVFQNAGEKLSNEMLVYLTETKNEPILDWNLSSFARNDKELYPSDIARRERDGAQSWISNPVFTKNRKYMLVEYSEFCGSLCGYGVTLIYKYKNGKWKRWKKIIEWVS